MVKALFSLALGLYEMRIKAHLWRPRADQLGQKNPRLRKFIKERATETPGVLLLVTLLFGKMSQEIYFSDILGRKQHFIDYN